MARKLLILVGAAAIMFSLGCKKDEEFGAMSQADWTAEGWNAWARGDYDGAETAFGNALKVDPYYPEAHGGLGWTYMRMQNLEEALGTFEDAILVSEQAGTPLAVRQLIYMGAATAYEANDEYLLSAQRGRYLINHLKGQTFVFGADSRVTGYDLYIILALDYYGLGQADNCVWAINKMRGMLHEPTNYQFSNWKNATTEIERLINKDPS
jgi:tetratricopeptide (TPR) repeat protein